MAYLAWRRGKYAELVRSVRADGRVRQERLAYLGARPVPTPALKARIEQVCPGEVDWPRVEAQILERGSRVGGSQRHVMAYDRRPAQHRGRSRVLGRRPLRRNRKP